MVTIVDTFYEPSSSVVAQGKPSKIREYEKRGYYVASGGFGSYRMVMPSKTIVYFTVEGEMDEEHPDRQPVHNQSVKQLIRDCYDVSRVTKQKFEEFVSDCNSGIINLQYSEASGLYV